MNDKILNAFRKSKGGKSFRLGFIQVEMLEKEEKIVL